MSDWEQTLISKMLDPFTERLVGEQMSAVAFVMDYVELHFNGRIVRALANPIVQVDGKRIRFPGVGSRDALCQLIGRSVSKAELVEGIAFTCHFGGSDAIVVPLDAARHGLPEAMHFQDSPNGPLMVW